MAGMNKWTLGLFVLVLLLFLGLFISNSETNFAISQGEISTSCGVNQSMIGEDSVGNAICTLIPVPIIATTKQTTASAYPVTTQFNTLTVPANTPTSFIITLYVNVSASTTRAQFGFSETGVSTLIVQCETFLDSVTLANSVNGCVRSLGGMTTLLFGTTSILVVNIYASFESYPTQSFVTLNFGASVTGSVTIQAGSTMIQADSAT